MLSTSHFRLPSRATMRNRVPKWPALRLSPNDKTNWVELGHDKSPGCFNEPECAKREKRHREWTGFTLRVLDECVCGNLKPYPIRTRRPWINFPLFPESPRDRTVLGESRQRFLKPRTSAGRREAPELLHLYDLLDEQLRYNKTRFLNLELTVMKDTVKKKRRWLCCEN